MAVKNLGKVAITPKGEFSEITTYQKLDVVTYLGSSYMALQESTGNLPTNTEYWQKIAEKGVNGEPGKDGLNGTNGIDGKDGISVSSIIQTTTSSESGGTNIITATLSDGSTSTFNIMNGAKGDTGKQGLQGEPGTNGTNGIDGQSATITVGSVTTLEAGSNATVTNVGTETNAIFNFGIPKGENGTDGHTPVKGTDYYTEADKQEMVELVLEALPSAEEVSY